VLKYVVKCLVSSLSSAFLLASAVGDFETWPPVYHNFLLDIQFTLAVEFLVRAVSS
jgi:hypothetical protein